MKECLFYFRFNYLVVFLLVLAFHCVYFAYSRVDVRGERKCLNGERSVLTLGSQVPPAYFVMYGIECEAPKKQGR